MLGIINSKNNPASIIRVKKFVQIEDGQTSYADFIDFSKLTFSALIAPFTIKERTIKFTKIVKAIQVKIFKSVLLIM